MVISMPIDIVAKPEREISSSEIRLKVNPLTLSFCDEFEHLEDRFHHHYFKANLTVLRIIHVIAILFYGLTGIPENILFPEALPVLWAIRYCAVIPLFFIGLGFSFTRYYEKCWYLISAIYILATGCGFILMIILGPKPQIYTYYVGIIICLFFGYTFARERFLHATIAGCSLVAIYFLSSVFIVDTPPKILLFNMMYMFIANFLGMLICCSIEYTARRDFILVHLYKDEKEKVAAANRDLEERVNTRTMDLTQTNQRLNEEIKAHRKAQQQKEALEASLSRAQKMESLGTMAGGVAHDLNNILTGVVSYPDLLLTDVPKDSAFRDALLTIKNSGEKAAAIVQDLLTLARRGVAISTVVNLNSIIEDYFKSPEFLKLQSFHPNVEYKIDLSGDLKNIMGSAIHLSKTIMNLISNAAESMPSGGTIEVTTKNVEINSPISGYEDTRCGSYNLVTVSDTGVGIAMEEMDRIFEPFYTKKVMGRSGTGLGMAVVWGTVHDHNGYIEIKSKLGKGSTFMLYLPKTDRRQSGAKESISLKQIHGNGESILVVDDVNEQRDIASQILTKLGYSVTTTSSGEDAVNYMRQHTADLVILDMIMDPGIDGLETYRQILEYHPMQKAIVASGFSETSRVEEMLRLGAGEYVRKPYTLEKIGMAVKNALDN